MALTLSLIFLWVGIAYVADVLFKDATALTDAKFLGGLALYMTTGFVAFLTFRRIEFGSMTILWNSLSLLAGLLISYFYYHEKFTFTTGCGAALAFAAAILISLK